jgi:integrase
MPGRKAGFPPDRGGVRRSGDPPSCLDLLQKGALDALLGGSLAAAMRDLSNLGRVVERPDGRSGWALDFGRQLTGRRYVYGWNGRCFGSRGTAEDALLAIRRLVAEGLAVAPAVASVLGEGRENSIGSRLDRFLELKREECEAGDRSPTYLRELERWFAADGHIGAHWRDKAIAQLDLRGVREWSSWLNRRKALPRRGSREKSRPLAGKTRWNVHGAMHAFMAWLAEEDRRVRMPVKWPWPPKTETAPTLITAETQDAILVAIPEADRGLFLAMALLGIRPGEAVALDVGDYRDGWLTISKARKGERLTSPIRGTKTGRVKRLPVPEELRAWIESHHDRESLLAGGPLFRNEDAHGASGRWSAAAMRRAWGRACATVGVRVGLYTGTKHSMATHLLNRGVQERHIQALLGHADARSTRRYARLGDQALVDALGRRNR